jgi:hypothetical protein
MIYDTEIRLVKETENRHSQGRLKKNFIADYSFALFCIMYHINIIL